ncbi:sensor histidine kinase [Nitrospira defluvii]|uniref:histidine kinase n=1 Tax=Nitrospira defluvii TaxID=330214 RepID=A0ABM8RTC3_9BACT|nr:ATP-binding protein [Nitrospira defluvii]CAE6770428.1 Histidine kinase [Nitrospira defluvii]
MRKIYRSLTFRLTLWYAVVFAVSLLSMLLVVYLMLAQRMDTRIDELLLSDALEFKHLYRLYGIENMEAEFAREAEVAGTDQVFFRLLSRNGSQLRASDLHAWKEVPVTQSILDHLAPDQPAFETVRVPGQPHHVRVVYFLAAEDQNVLQVGYLRRDDERFLEEYRHISVAVILAGIFLAASLGWFMARRALGGVEHVTETARVIGTGDFARRVIVSNRGDEIDHLAVTFNMMLDKIQSLIVELKQVTSDIAHDLRSPITRIRGMAETTLLEDTTIPAYQEMAGLVVEESDRLVAIINSLLEIAEADAGVAQLARSDFDMTGMVQDAVELFRPVAEDRAITFQVTVPSSRVIHTGDKGKLQRVLANLIDNALKYTGPGGRVLVSVEDEPAHVKVSVADNGIGIEEHDLSHIFDRFYRADRSRSTCGNGLGLSLAQAFVKAHQGHIEVESCIDKGSTFCIVLPH